MITSSQSTVSSRRPVLVSFYSGDDHYRDAAAKLRYDCLQLDLDHDIVEYSTASERSWIDLCRRKIPFYLEMHRKHQRPILWLDVDSRLTRSPDVFNGATCDIAGFLRGFRYLRGFDPLSVPRFFAPFALYFNFTPRATAFLELMADLERKYSGSATDDFFLQEAWEQHREQLSVMVLPPDLVGRGWPLTAEQIIYVGISGNVSAFKAQAKQHVAEVLAPERRKTVLLHEADEARKNGQTADALVLYKRALAIAPDDTLAEKIVRLSPREHGLSEQVSLIKSDQTVEPAIEPAKVGLRSVWKRWLMPRNPR